MEVVQMHDHHLLEKNNPIGFSYKSHTNLYKSIHTHMYTDIPVCFILAQQLSSNDCFIFTGTCFLHINKLIGTKEKKKEKEK